MPEFKESQLEIEKAVALDRLHQKIETLKQSIELTDRGLKSLQEDRDKALRWGLITLGSTVLGMGIWIFGLFERMVIPH